MQFSHLDFEEKIEAYLQVDRQWPRHLRILYAEAQKKKATSDEDRRFWNAVIRRNKD